MLLCQTSKISEHALFCYSVPAVLYLDLVVDMLERILEPCAKDGSRIVVVSCTETVLYLTMRLKIYRQLSNCAILCSEVRGDSA
jgi:hypothetical protein